MTSTIKVDTISEKTSANGVSIDGLTIKDGGITATTGAIVFNEASADLDFRVESNGNANMLVVDGGDDDVRIGTATSFGPHDAGLKVKGDITIGDFTNDSASATLGFIKSRNTTVGSQTIVASDDEIGRIAFRADDGNDANYNNNVAAIAVQIDAGPGTDDTGGRIMFETTADGARVGTERLRIDNSGNVIVKGSNANLTFSSTGNNITFARNSDNYISASGGTSSNLVLEGQNRLVLQTASTERLRIDNAGEISSNAETSPDVSRGGLCLNQGSNDTNILTFKSDDVAHGMTSSAETDTYALFSKQSATKGGLQIRTFCEDLAEERLQINVQGEGDVTEATNNSTKGAIAFTSSGKSGTGQGAQNANGNIMSIHNYTTTRFLFEGNGEFHADASSNTFDEYEDAQLVRAFDLSHGKGVIDSKFDKFVAYNHEKLADLKLVGREDDGTPNHFVNVTGFQRLHNGAIWQQYEKHQRLAEAVYEMAKEALGEEKADAILEKHEIKLLN